MSAGTPQADHTPRLGVMVAVGFRARNMFTEQHVHLQVATDAQAFLTTSVRTVM